jgi:hypothetical protein
MWGAEIVPDLHVSHKPEDMTMDLWVILNQLG